MRLVSIKNVSKESVSIQTKNGSTISLPPNQSWSDVDVVNLDELRNKVTFVSNLTEVNSAGTKQKLYD